MMKTVTIQLSVEIATLVEQAARENGVSPEDFVRISVEERLARDDEFEKATRHVLAKNAELYERLSGK